MTLATAIVEALKVNLGAPIAAPTVHSPPTHDVEAYDLYLQGKAFLDRPTVPGFEQAVTYFRRALSARSGVCSGACEHRHREIPVGKPRSQAHRGPSRKQKARQVRL